MNYEDEQLDRAFGAVTCLMVARHFGLNLQVGVQKSPFREDKKGKSFSLVPPDGKFFKDHANDDGGGVWPFVKLCAEHAGRVMSGKEIRDLLVELNGETPEKLKKGVVKRQVAEKRKDLYRSAASAARDLPPLGKPVPGPWSVPVRDWWDAGKGLLLNEAEKFSDERGWDADVIDALVQMNKTSLPLCRWGRNNGWSWVVEKPVFERGVLNFITVGYHQRYFVFSDGDRERRFDYVPCIPVEKPGRTLNEFQQHLKAMGTRLPTYPFVLGDPQYAPRLVIGLEGQFDAVSFALAFGWFRDTSAGIPPGVFIFGFRGAQSHNPFLSSYGLWLRKHKPFVWIIGDNDAAGRKIDAVKDVNAIAAEPTFVDRIRAQGCTVHAELIGHPGCKDFNDVWKAARPSVETMMAWAKGVGAPEIF